MERLDRSPVSRITTGSSNSCPQSSSARRADRRSGGSASLCRRRGLEQPGRLIGILGTLLPIIQRYRLGEKEMLGDRGEWLPLLTGEVPDQRQRDWLLGVCLKMSGSMDQRRVSTAKRLVEEAERYIPGELS